MKIRGIRAHARSIACYGVCVCVHGECIRRSRHVLCIRKGEHHCARWIVHRPSPQYTIQSVVYCCSVRYYCMILRFRGPEHVERRFEACGIIVSGGALFVDRLDFFFVYGVFFCCGGWGFSFGGCRRVSKLGNVTD